MHSLPVFGLGIFFALAGLGLFAMTLVKAKEAAAAKAGVPLKKSELRDFEAQKTAKQTEANKLRIAGAVCVAVGAALMTIS